MKINIDMKLVYTFWLCLQSTAWAQAEYGPSTPPGRLYNLNHGPVYFLPPVNVDSLRAADEIEQGQNLPFRFGYAIKTSFDIVDDGTEAILPDGSSLWRMTVYAPGAYSLNFVFDAFFMPEGGELYIYSPEHDFYRGAFTHKSTRSDSAFATAPLPGDRVVFEYRRFPGSPPAKLKLGTTVYGYKDVFFKNTSGYGDSGSCNVNVNCPAGANWQNQKKGVAMILTSGGTRICSGSLINNVRQDGKPYFLTAQHCLDSGSNNWIFMFNYESPGCTNQNGPTNQTLQGCVTRASWSSGDFALLELNQRPQSFYNVYYNGWNRTTSAPAAPVGIHHPSGDVKKISFDNQSAVSGTYTSLSNGHWRVVWDTGTTEGGSSGSPLFNSSGQIVGDLSGGLAACSRPNESDYYGKFSVNWSGNNTNSTRLSNWLDPDNTGVTSLNGAYITECNLSASIGADKNSICRQQESAVLTASATGANGSVSYSWAPSTGLNATVGAVVTANPTVNTVYTVTATDGANCSATATFTLTVISPPTATLSTADGKTRYCRHDASVALNADVSGGSFSGPGVSNGTFNPNTAGVGTHVVNYFGGTLPPYTFTNDLVRSIADNTCSAGTGLTSTISVSGLPTVLTQAMAAKMFVALNINHTWVRDLVVFLRSPSNARTLLLVYRVGGQGAVNMVNTVLSDDGTIPIWEGVAPFTGTYRPDGYLETQCGLTSNIATFSAFAGVNPNGTWTLRIFDAAADDTGTLQNWTLGFGNENPCAASGTLTLQVVANPTVSASSSPSLPGQNTGSVTAVGAGGNAPYAYSLNGGVFQSDATFNGLASGSYVVTVRDANDCSASVIVSVQESQAVWPGDADNNGTVTLTDYYFTAAAYNRTGPARALQGITWQAYAAPALWATSQLIQGATVNHMYTDANGDGVVNLFDLAATVLNRGRTR